MIGEPAEGPRSPGRASTGIRGLDEVVSGGFLRNRAYLVRGAPGVGKTVLGLHFLDAGVKAGETVLFISLGTKETELRTDAATFGFDLSAPNFHVLDLSPKSAFFSEKQVYDIFEAPEVEREEFVDAVVTAIDDIAPDRVVIDPITELRTLTPNRQQFREQVRSFLFYLKEHDITVLVTSEAGPETPDTDLQYISDGNVHLEFGPDYHQLEVTKLRGSMFERGPHFVTFTDEGLDVFSVAVPTKLQLDFEPVQLASGVENLDAMLYGGIERGTSTLVSGATGVGKTTIAAQFVATAAANGTRAVVYLFEETEATFTYRLRSIGIPVRQYIDDGLIDIQRVEPYEHAPEQFARIVRHAVEDEEFEIVMLDGIEGYLASVEGDTKLLIRRLHSLVSYMRNQGVTPILTAEVHSITGTFRASEHKASYLADNIVFVTYYEYEGALNRAIGVLKKRATPCESALHAFSITSDGVTVGDRLSELRGVLWGSPGVVEMLTEKDD
ncbi:ATPase domain-containing protein [Halorarius litoreus]|uniref:ATPase domain-containing protein n=1 Tax=Halorarius litoreus TaxID=2962676 RepID=UPI0020CCEB2C|nr:ATPase domain-containing protein [Halorarius litoreus]